VPQIERKRKKKVNQYWKTLSIATHSTKIKKRERKKKVKPGFANVQDGTANLHSL